MMRFHAVHGAGVDLDAERKAARRTGSGGTQVGEAVVFSDSAVEVGSPYTVSLDTADPRGLPPPGEEAPGPSPLPLLLVGLCSFDPAAGVPEELLRGEGGRPDQRKVKGLWTSQVDPRLLRPGNNRLSLCLTADYELYLCVNNRPAGSQLPDLPRDQRKPLWLVLVLAGTGVESVRFVTTDETVPVEILARGAEACRAYRKTLQEERVVIRRGRIFLIGHEKSGKTCLSSTLCGEPPPSSSSSASRLPMECLDVGSTCRIRKDGRWTKLATATKTPLLSEDHRDHLASSTASSVLFGTREAESQSTSSASSRRMSVSAKLFSRVFSSNRVKPGGGGASTTSPPPPPEVLSLLEEYLQRMRTATAKVHDEEEEEEGEATAAEEGDVLLESRDVLGAIWRFGGREELLGVQQIFLADEPLYVLTFDLTLDLDAKARKSYVDEEDGTLKCGEAEDRTNLDVIMDWVRLVGQKCRVASVDQWRPRIIVVGTHKDRLHKVEVMQLSMANFKFERLLEEIKTSGLEHLVSFPFLAVDATQTCKRAKRKESDGRQEGDEEGGGGAPAVGERCTCSLCPLKKRAHQLLSAYGAGAGVSVPRHWLDMEATAAELAGKGIHFADKTQLAECFPSFRDEGDFEAMLSFYNQLGLLLRWPNNPDVVVLSPQVLANLLGKMISRNLYKQVRQEQTLSGGLISKEAFGAVADSADFSLAAAEFILNMLDTIVRDPSTGVSFAPTICWQDSGGGGVQPVGLETKGGQLAIFFDVYEYFPAFLYDVVLVNLIRQYLEKSPSSSFPSFAYTPGRLVVHLQQGHQMELRLLEKGPGRKRRMAMVVMKGQEDETPNPQICLASLRSVESSVSHACSRWLSRLHFRSLVPCPCKSRCDRHQHQGCRDTACLHFLELNEALSSQTVLCDFKKVETKAIRQFFPSDISVKAGMEPSSGLLASLYSLSQNDLVLSPGQLHKREISSSSSKVQPQSPKWLKGAVKLLESGFDGEDWRALADLLGYKTKKIEDLDDSLQPARWLFKDWLASSGNTKLSVEMLCACLEDIKRNDVVEVIMDVEREEADVPLQVFISYHWDNQEEVLLLRSSLDRAGISCWMDVGQMGGGDRLYAEIYKGIHSCQVFLACVSSRYAVSDSCCKELSLADLLHKPVIPIMIERTPWPPPGPMALLFSQLVYVDLAGSGGHGGAGKHADWKKKVSDLILRIQSYLIVLDHHKQEQRQRRRRHNTYRLDGLQRRKKSPPADVPVQAAEVGGRLYNNNGDEEDPPSSSPSSGPPSPSTPSSSSSSSSSSAGSAQPPPPPPPPPPSNPVAWIAAESERLEGGHRRQQQQQQQQQRRRQRGNRNSCCKSCQVM